VAYDRLQVIYKDRGATDDIKRKELDWNYPEACLYSGKVHSVDFFLTNMLPAVKGLEETITTGDRSPLVLLAGIFRSPYILLGDCSFVVTTEDMEYTDLF
jgi:hypothetical protein